MSDTTTHSQDPHDPTVDVINLLRTAGVINDSRHAEKQAAQAASWIARWSETPENVDPKAWAAGLRRLATLMFKPDEPLVDLIQRMSHVAGEPSDLSRRVVTDEHPVEQCLHDSRNGLTVRVVLVDERVGVSHETSPSVVDAGAHSVGDGPGAGDASATPATWVTDNWDTGKMAGHVEVIKVDGDPTQLLIDGEPFPYLLAAEPFKVLAGEDDATRVTVTFFAEKITESERLTSDPSKPYVHFNRGGFPGAEVTLDSLVAAVRDTNLDIKSLRRVDDAARANYNESGRNLAKAIKDRANSERALLDYLTGDQA